MTDLLDLYGLAEEHGTEIYWFDLGTAESLSLPLEDGSCAIAMDPWRMSTLADEKVKLAHELGHCETGAFYNRYADEDIALYKQIFFCLSGPRRHLEAQKSPAGNTFL